MLMVYYSRSSLYAGQGTSGAAVTGADVFGFLAGQRGDRSVVRLADQESGLSARTIARRLSSVSGLYACLIARGDTPLRANPVPRGLSTRSQGGSRRSRTVPLVRVPRTLLATEEVDRLIAALRTHRDKAMVLAMVLAGLQRCEVLGVRARGIVAAGQDQRRCGGAACDRAGPICETPGRRSAFSLGCRTLGR